MLEHLPFYISFFFVMIAIITLVLFYRTIRSSNVLKVRQYAYKVLIGLGAWLLLQAILSIQNVYSPILDFFPPAIFLLGVLPPLLMIVGLFIMDNGKVFVDSLPLINLTYLNIIRIPVEIILYWLFMYEVIPELMTFHGRNFDVLIGITAPLMAYYGLLKRRISQVFVMLWNFIGLVFLLNVVIHAFLSAPSPVQKIALDQPIFALLYFPFSWLPTFIVPLILFGHLASIRKLSIYRFYRDGKS